MLVMKFGGTSVASAPNIRKVKAILQEKKVPFLVVVSAFSGTTDKLQEIAHLALDNAYTNQLEELKKHHIKIAEELIDLTNQAEVLIFIQKQFNLLQTLCEGIAALQELSERTLAKVMGLGEQLSSFIIHRYLKQEKLTIDLLESKKIIKANGNYLKGELNQQLTKAAMKNLDTAKSYIAPGFISSNTEGETVLLGRGGSDYSAAIYAAGLGADGLEIWSDVDGMLNANPKMVSAAKTIHNLSYKEAFELSHFGAKVLYAPTIRPVMDQNIPVFLKNTFTPSAQGTYIGNLNHEINRGNVKGISSIDGLSILTVSGVGMAGIKGTASRVFQALEQGDVNVVLITQCCSEQSICIGVKDKDAETAVSALKTEFEKEISRLLVDDIHATSDYAVVALVGDQMKMKVGLSGKVFGALGANGINVIAIAQGASERNISVVIDKKDEKKAVNVLHERFFSDATKKIHLFVAGAGNVGGQFLNIIKEQQATLLRKHKINLKVIGIANSKKLWIEEEGIDLEGGLSINEKGDPYQQFSEFVTKIKELNLRNSIFIDNTASEVVSEAYKSILKQSISIIACNKIACSSAYENYIYLKQLAQKRNCHFKYETTVGAALPVIQTIQNLIQSGDKVHKIQAVLSGSLNFIFNNYNDTNTFVEVVKRAKEEGYTEPNPLIDLSGKDVMRKILILAREAGYALEMEDVGARPFLPQSCFEMPNVEALFEDIAKNEAHFRKMYNDAQTKNHRLKVVATFEKGKASVGLESIAPDSPFYHLEGKDNIVSVNSARYPQEPLVIKGAGAGAELTASGVFSDLMLIVNN